ncbi:hypothetical protein B0H63DRAFT_234719 [Podospora didyma]|uniref:Secreted protein n=1 Tax=Podospora didyma TaxID=330526 RepID=A0AAE0KKS6_9PEZI|nr:hypothetical protein B0H63DRAFT_234719 [Podospora didyma]
MLRLFCSSAFSLVSSVPVCLSVCLSATCFMSLDTRNPPIRQISPSSCTGPPGLCCSIRSKRRAEGSDSVRTVIHFAKPGSGPQGIQQGISPHVDEAIANPL